MLLSYWLTPTRSHLWLVSADQVRHVTLPPAKDIEVLVREHQRSIESATADVIATAGTAGDRLYAILLEPVARWVPAGSKVVIAPDGALHRLNFETLPVKVRHRQQHTRPLPRRGPGDPGRAGAVPSSARQTAPPEPTAASSSSAIRGLASPSSRRSRMRRPKWMRSPALPGDRVTAFRSDGASPAAYTGAGAERYAMIHFTAHATANTDSPLDSAVILSGPDNAYKLYARDIAAGIDPRDRRSARSS